MVSNIDPTKPQTGIDQPVQVIRDNFAIAKIEIEDLQASKLNATGGTLTGVIRLDTETTANLPDPTTNTAGLIYVSDGSPQPAPFYSNGSEWRPLFREFLDELSDVNVGTPGASEDGFRLVWNNSAGEYQLSGDNSQSLQILTDAINISWNQLNSTTAQVTITDDRTLSNPTNGSEGLVYTLKVIQDIAGGHILNFGSTFKFPGGMIPILSTAPGAVDILRFWYDGSDYNLISESLDMQ